MSAALIVLKPRQVKPAEDALAELPDWLTVVEIVGYSERELADGIFRSTLDAFPHDVFLVASDDVIIRKHAVEAVLRLVADGVCASGYCQLTHTDWRVNATRAPLKGILPTEDAYDFLRFDEVISGPPVRRSWFTGMSLTTMTAEMWARFPFGCFTSGPDCKGYASDFHLSRRLAEAGIPIVLARDAFCYHWRHVRENTNDPRDDKLLVGAVKPEIRRFERSRPVGSHDMDGCETVRAETPGTPPFTPTGRVFP